MAFTTAERVKIRTYLGRSLLYRELDSRLESVINLAETTAGYEDAIRDRLTELDAIVTALSSSKDNQILERAEDVTFRGPIEITELCRLGRLAINAICLVLGFTPEHDYFDQFVGGTAGGLGGFYPLG